MSSDDDLDEDELLQMALKEQSQRNVNYQKPASSKSKPVRNYVQPPATRGGGRSAGAAAQHQKKGTSKQKKQPLDEDDDSEVEMLSISSGDEDDRGVAAKSRGGGKKAEDKAWDGGEPSCWKHVDEAEVLCF